MSNGLKFVCVALVGVGVAAYALRGSSCLSDSAPRRSAVSRATPEPEAEPDSVAPEESVSRREATSPSANPTAATVASAPLTVGASSYPSEAALMAKLRDIGESDPELSILLARAGNTRYPNSLEAAERAWRIAKSLVNLRRFHEARDEAKAMVEKYRGTEWANDVERHLLVHPLDYPSREDLQRMASEADAQAP